MHGYYTAYVKPTYTVVKYICTASKSKSKAPLSYTMPSRLRSNDNLQIRNPRGIMSKKAQQRIRNAVNWLVMATPRKKVYNAKTKKALI